MLTEHDNCPLSGDGPDPEADPFPVGSRWRVAGKLVEVVRRDKGWVRYRVVGAAVRRTAWLDTEAEFRRLAGRAA